jgi:cell division protease FtsH
MKGLIFHGPPGTGKTLMAKAIAGEMNCHFIAASGSQFVELYVGMGAKRVRELFNTARNNAPCIIFIDEIDAFAIKRGSNRSHSELDQTVNELLAQMDGFKDNTGILVIAATNNLESLDDAVLRPGRFDRKIKVELPTIEGRKEILDLYISKNKKMENISIDSLARQTIGFSGAELKNLVDMAIYEAIKAKRETITMEDFTEAKSKIQMGAVSNIKLDEAFKESTAYHEVGHALVAKLIDGPKVEHISILPRGQSLGQTVFSAEEKYSHSKEDIIKQIKIALGGRVAEKMNTYTESTGASHDLKMATNLARSLVCRFGMSEFGPINVDFNSQEYMSFSEHTKQKLDEETFKLLRNLEGEVDILLKNNLDLVKYWAQKLVEKENITADEFYG